MKHLDRRQFLTTSMLAAGGLLMTSRLTLASTANTSSRFVFILLRGALDGLSAVPPYGDHDYARLRGELQTHFHHRRYNSTWVSFGDRCNHFRCTSIC